MFVATLLPLAQTRLVTILETAPLVQAAALLRTGIDLVVVCHTDNSLAGVLTKTDVVGQIGQCSGASCTYPISGIMTIDVLLCRLGDPLSALWNQMKARGIKNVPLIDDGSSPIGVVTARDVLQTLLKDSESEELLLRDYVMGFGYR